MAPIPSPTSSSDPAFRLSARWLAPSTLLVAMLASGAAGQAFDFGLPPTTFAAGDGPSAVAIADFDGDGIADLAVADQHDDQVRVLLGIGGGAYAAPALHAVGSQPQQLVVADINGDAKDDLVVRCSQFASVYVLLGQGDGTFAFGGAPGFAGLYLTAIAVGDIDGDGDLDLVGSKSNDAMEVRKNNGNGTFGLPLYVGLPKVHFTMELADMDGDGDLDLVTGESIGSNQVQVRLNNGTGAYFPPVNYPVAGTSLGMAVLDVDADGALDVIVAVAGAVSVVSVLHGAGDGTLGAPVLFPVGSRPLALAVADMDADDVPDLVTCSAADQEVAVLRGLGGGVYAAAEHFATGRAEWELAGGDLDGDGLPDIALADGENDSVSLLFNLVEPQWDDLGFALAGLHGEPELDGTGDLTAGTPVTLALANARENAVTYLVVGAAQVDLPFYGGTLVPAFGAPLGLFVALSTDGAGGLVVGGSWPAGIPSGFALHFQHWIVDPAGPFGLAASNALRATAP